MPAPEPAPEALAAHLLSCAPCREEQEGMQEVDRRLQRLGAFIQLQSTALSPGLELQLRAALPGPAPAQRSGRPPPWRALAWAGLVLLSLVLLGVGVWARLR